MIVYESFSHIKKMLGRTETRTRDMIYCQTIRSVRDISRDDRARIATCRLRTPTDRQMDRLTENYSIDYKFVNLNTPDPGTCSSCERFHVKSITQKPDHLQFCSNFTCLFTSMIEATVPNFRKIGQVFLQIRPPKKLKFYPKNCA